MNFNFMPYKLNADISDFKGKIEYISSDNGVDLYNAREGLEMPLLGFQVKQVNLYFYEANLITVYIQLAENSDIIQKVKGILDEALAETGKVMEADSGLLYYWQDKNQLLGLMIKDEGKFLLLYNSLNKFNVFNQ